MCDESNFTSLFITCSGADYFNYVLIHNTLEKITGLLFMSWILGCFSVHSFVLFLV